jgi:hypothetical protein
MMVGCVLHRWRDAREEGVHRVLRCSPHRACEGQRGQRACHLRRHIQGTLPTHRENTLSNMCTLYVCSLQEFNYKALAVALTAIELEDGILTVRPREFVCKRWMDASLKTVHPDLGGCLHLTRLIESSNQRIAVSRLDTTDIQNRSEQALFELLMVYVTVDRG